MTNWIQLFQKISKQEREAAKICDIQTATIESIEPLKVRISEKHILDSDFLILTESFYEMLPDMNKGDKIIVLRKGGGQKFLLLGREVII